MAKKKDSEELEEGAAPVSTVLQLTKEDLAKLGEKPQRRIKKDDGTESDEYEEVAGPNIIDMSKRVKVKIIKDDDNHFYTKGDVIETGIVHAAKIEKNGWGNIITMIALFMMFTFGAAQAQQRLVRVYANTTNTFDSVTNTGTAYLSTTAQLKSGVTSLAIQVVATKLSGTVAGTISLLGSVDGVNFKAATVAEASTAIPTWTATDVASQTFIWRLAASPYTYYRVSWTGTGTMLATQTATIITK